MKKDFKIKNDRVTNAIKRLGLNKREGNALHMHFTLDRLGFKISTDLNRKEFTELVYEVAELFEDKPKVNDLGRWSLRNKIKYMERDSNEDVLEEYFRPCVPNLPKHFLNSITDIMFTKVIYTILGIGVIPIIERASIKNLKNLVTDNHVSYKITDQKMLNRIVDGKLKTHSLAITSDSAYLIGLRDD